MSVKTEEVTIETPSGKMSGYLALPEKTPAPGVVVIQEIFGVNEHIQSVTRRAAEAGYVALAPDLFWQAKPGFTSGYSPEEIEFARGLLGQVSLDQAVEDVQATMTALAARPETRDEKLGVMGFCWGGLMTFLVSSRLQPACAASYYGGRVAQFLSEAPGISNPIMFHFGEKDAAIPLEEVEQVKKALSGKSNTEVHVYPDAAHGFHCDMRGSYHEPSAKQAWERTLAFFSKHLA